MPHAPAAIRVLTVDDSPLARELIRFLLEPEPDIQIVGEASNGKEAIEMVASLKPHVVTMDLEMPVMGGMEAIERIMELHPVPILVITSLSGVRTAFAAVSKGALDVIEKPELTPESGASLAGTIRTLARVDVAVHAAVRVKAGPAPLPAPGRRGSVVAIAASTGGPAAIYQLLSGLPADFALPILVSQHIAEGFTQGLADWMAGGSRFPVSVARNGEQIKPGQVYLNPAEHAMRLRGERIVLGPHDPSFLYHPSCNTLLASVAEAYRGGTVGVILTGMGDDGVEGMRAIKGTGGITLAQDGPSSMIYGMNKQAIDQGLVDTVLPLDQIAPYLARLGAK
ncbi:chemotaxis-specific protein-glutamate methyltransferase CheB [Geomesophilobacter sediminis]|uniref:Protein-glutamate methylesterase/protein-glutamine glutaminase n=1 Tax=Geomesophilobacter sediminis TaxID=2798584 RepID=A0A8J7M228_9BACT|nr:chemotaxis-specific protein-glutamate methyltransferase CheB [Geomesophilobacter sediminis]MBJ6727138.1 chemotaxis-specific protein-glutamate methyltransferase CheB [Geomesophilobacter sediminis]